MGNNNKSVSGSALAECVSKPLEEALLTAASEMSDMRTDLDETNNRVTELSVGLIGMQAQIRVLAEWSSKKGDLGSNALAEVMRQNLQEAFPAIASQPEAICTDGNDTSSRVSERLVGLDGTLGQMRELAKSPSQEKLDESSTLQASQLN